MTIARLSRVAACTLAIAAALGWTLPARVAAQGQDLPPASGSGRLPEDRLPPGLPPLDNRKFPPTDLDAREKPALPIDTLTFENVRAQLLKEARAIEIPNEKALAFIRMANAAIFSDRLDDADDYLHEAVVPARNAETPLLRDQRTTAIVNSLMNLAEARLRDVRETAVNSIGSAEFNAKSRLDEAKAAKKIAEERVPDAKKTYDQQLRDAKFEYERRLREAKDEFDRRVREAKKAADQKDQPPLDPADNPEKLLRQAKDDAEKRRRTAVDDAEKTYLAVVDNAKKSADNLARVSREVNQQLREVNRDVETRVRREIVLSRESWTLAAVLAAKIEDPTYQCDLMYRTADSLSFGAQTVAINLPRSAAGDDQDTRGPNPYDETADDMLNDAADLSTTIPWPVWRDRGLVQVSANASTAGHYVAGLRAARRIPQPEVRVDGLLKVAEAQSKFGRRPDATATYREAAVAVSSIPLDDPRAVLAGVLIDSLIAVGRFEDARACVDLYPDQPRRLIALGAIAQSQGRRGAGESAREWITREVEPAHRNELYRRVNDGILFKIEENRGRELSNPRAGAGNSR